VNDEDRTAQINIAVPQSTKRKIDQRIAELAADTLKAGQIPISKQDLILAAVWKYLISDLDAAESMEWAKKKLQIQSVVEDVRQRLEEALHV
jgi:hypothetical protein